MKPHDNRAWGLLVPAGLVMAVVGIIPLVTVFNYSVLDIFTLQQVHWVGVDWYRDIVSSERFHHTLARSVLFSSLVLGIQMPLAYRHCAVTDTDAALAHTGADVVGAADGSALEHDPHHVAEPVQLEDRACGASHSLVGSASITSSPRCTHGWCWC